MISKLIYTEAEFDDYATSIYNKEREDARMILYHPFAIPKKFPILVDSYIRYSVSPAVSAAIAEGAVAVNPFNKIVSFIWVDRNLAKCLVYPKTNPIKLKYTDDSYNKWSSYIAKSDENVEYYRVVSMNNFIHQNPGEACFQTPPLYGETPCLITHRVYQSVNSLYISADNPLGLLTRVHFFQVNLNAARNLVYYNKNQKKKIEEEKYQSFWGIL